MSKTRGAKGRLDAVVRPERTHTARGFARTIFRDRYDKQCSLQESSLATEHAVWLGIDDAEPQVLASQAAAIGVHTTENTGWVPYPLPHGVHMTTRMHLTRDQAAWLIEELQHFVDTGEVRPNASFSRGPSGPSAGSDSCASKETK